MHKIKWVIPAVLLTAIALYACSKGGDGGGDNGGGSTDEFKAKMLVNYADNIIIPGYNDLSTKVNAFEQTVTAFLDAPSATSQTAMKAPFKAAWLSLENVSVDYFGPAAALLLNATINTFPAVPAKIENGISTGSYNLTLPVASDSLQGFPALDYLLFEQNAVTNFTSGANIDNRKKYVRDVLARMKTLIGNVIAQWNNTYRTAFVNSLKTDVGSSIGFLVNQFAYEMDAMKGPRIGWPFGKQSNGIVFADKCEGYYSGISRDLAVANLTSLKNHFVGGAAEGISDYLVLLKKTDLNDAVLAQFDVAINALKAIPDPMSAAFSNNATLVEEAYKQVQKLLTLIKTDVASATGVQITYQDNDGD